MEHTRPTLESTSVTIAKGAVGGSVGDSFSTLPRPVAASLLGCKPPLCHHDIPVSEYCRACDNLSSLAKAVKGERGAGLKYDSGKGRWSLLMQGCSLALAGVVEVLGFGAKKYAAHSWKVVENGEERYRDALYRHLHAIERGEELDPESGLPHWDHLLCNACFLSQKYHESK